jgi:hypothetical protein
MEAVSFVSILFAISRTVECMRSMRYMRGGFIFRSRFLWRDNTDRQTNRQEYVSKCATFAGLAAMFDEGKHVFILVMKAAKRSWLLKITAFQEACSTVNDCGHGIPFARALDYGK